MQKAPIVEGKVCAFWCRTAGGQGTEPPRTEVFVRHRADAKQTVNENGLSGSFDYHKTPRLGGYLAESEAWVRNERALMLQSRRHYKDLAEKFPPHAQELLSGACGWGEQVTIDEGMHADNICVGDVIEVEGSTVELTVVFPRLCCIRVDMRWPMGLQSAMPGTVRQYASAYGRGGIFCKVDSPGVIEEGSRMTVAKRPNPTWTLSRVSQMCYSSTPMNLTFKGTDEELQELCEMPELGMYEWKERLLIAREAILKSRPLNLPPKYGCPVSYDEGMTSIEGEWRMVGCSVDFCVNLVFEEARVSYEDPELCSKELCFGSSRFVGKPKNNEGCLELDVTMGGFPMIGALFKNKNALFLVLSSGSVWSSRR